MAFILFKVSFLHLLLSFRLNIKIDTQKFHFKSKFLYSLQSQQRKLEEITVIELIELKDKSDLDLLNNIIKAMISPIKN
jgi:hypothetical protein